MQWPHEPSSYASYFIASWCYGSYYCSLTRVVKICLQQHLLSKRKIVPAEMYVWMCYRMCYRHAHVCGNFSPENLRPTAATVQRASPATSQNHRFLSVASFNPS